MAPAACFLCTMAGQACRLPQGPRFCKHTGIAEITNVFPPSCFRRQIRCRREGLPVTRDRTRPAARSQGIDRGPERLVTPGGRGVPAAEVFPVAEAARLPRAAHRPQPQPRQPAADAGPLSGRCPFHRGQRLAPRDREGGPGVSAPPAQRRFRLPAEHGERSLSGSADPATGRRGEGRPDPSADPGLAQAAFGVCTGSACR